VKVKSLVCDEIQNLDAVGVTCDHWVHDVLKVSYLTITCQYVKNSVVIARVLATIPTENKRSATIKSDIKTVLESFNLDKTAKFFVTDNASAMKSAFSTEKWFACSSHDLNLVQFHTFESLENPYLNRYLKTPKI